MNKKYVDENEMLGYVVVDTYPTGFKARLEQFRASLGLTQEKFADTIGISKESYKQIKDNPSLQMIYKVAKAYPELSIDYLVLGNGAMLREVNNVNNIEITSVKGHATNVQGSGNSVNVSDENLKRLMDMQQKLIDYVTSNGK